MRVFVVLLLVVISLSVSHAQEEEPLWAGMQQHLNPTGLEVKDGFPSRNIALAGDTAFISMPYAGYNGHYFVGLITPFKRVGDTWLQQATIFPPEEELRSELHFGSSLSADGNYLAVSTVQKCVISPVWPYLCKSPGEAILIYVRNGDDWVFDTKITEVPDISGQHVRIDGGLVDGETVVIEGTRVMRDDLDDAEGDVFLYNRIDGIWTLTALFSNDPNDPHKFFRAAGLSQDGNSLLMRGANRLHVFNRNTSNWALSAVIKPPANAWRVTSAALNDRGDTVAVMYSWSISEYSSEYALYIYRFYGSTWEVVFTASEQWEYYIPLAFSGDTLAVGSGHRMINVYEDSRSVARIYKEIDGKWKQYSVLPIYRTPLPNEDIDGEGMRMGFDGDYLLTDMQLYIEPTGTLYEIWALKIPGVEQDVPQTIGGQNTPNVLPLPKAPSDYRDAAPSDYSVFHAALKTRPTRTVKLRLTTNGNVLLDVGGIASPVLTLKFTRDNWNIPQEVRARLSASQSSALSAIVREEIVGTSAHEYKLIKAAKVRVNVPQTAFMQDTPAQASALPDGTPVTFTWRPYSLATRYVVKLKRVGSTRQFKYPVDPATACTIDLCTVTLDRTALPKGSVFKWRVVAQDQPAAFSRATTWSKFTFTPPQ
jgi:hypothetical protein